jgi:hypothetical protein
VETEPGAVGLGREADPRRSWIPVQDAATLKAFLTNASNEWLAQHEEAPQRRGRPSAQQKVFSTLWAASDGGQIRGKPSQGKLIRLVQERLGRELSDDAIRKHVKTWVILNKDRKRLPDLSLSRDDLNWLNKHAMALMRAFKEYREAAEELRGSIRRSPVQLKLTRPLPPELIKLLSAGDSISARFKRVANSEKAFTAKQKQFEREIKAVYPPSHR